LREISDVKRDKADGARTPPSTAENPIPITRTREET